jgi:membrane-associated phospholipid phosphatase
LPKATLETRPQTETQISIALPRVVWLWLVALAVITVAVVLCVAFIDRPIAQFMDVHVRNTRWFDYLDDFFGIIPAAVPLALVVLFGAGCLELMQRRRPAWLATPLLCSWSLVWSLAATLVFKHVFGRTGAEDYAANGSYEFSFMHGGPIFGGPGHDSFPSGTMAVAGAVVGVLWMAYPRLRLLWALIMLWIAVALVLTDFHFIGDIIGGTYLGLLIAALTIQLHRPTEHP